MAHTRSGQNARATIVNTTQIAVHHTAMSHMKFCMHKWQAVTHPSTEAASLLSKSMKIKCMHMMET
jgi:hypothetical protein